MDKQEITIGMKDATSDRIREILLHEIMEAVFSSKMMRYKLPYVEECNEHYLFSFNHLEFENCITDVALALKEVLNG